MLGQRAALAKSPQPSWALHRQSVWLWWDFRFRQPFVSSGPLETTGFRDPFKGRSFDRPFFVRAASGGRGPMVFTIKQAHSPTAICAASYFLYSNLGHRSRGAIGLATPSFWRTGRAALTLQFERCLAPAHAARRYRGGTGSPSSL